jgi:hypothetical protein
LAEAAALTEAAAAAPALNSRRCRSARSFGKAFKYKPLLVLLLMLLLVLPPPMPPPAPLLSPPPLLLAVLLRLWRKSRSSHLKYHLDRAAWVLSGEIHAMKNCVHSNCGITSMSSEVDVRFIALLSPFGRKKGPVF